MHYQSPTIAWRGKLARLMADVQREKPQDGQRSGRIRCICGSTLSFTIASTGKSSGQCSASCGARWDQ